MRESITPLVLIVAIIAFYYIAMAIIERKPASTDIPTMVHVPIGWDSQKMETDKEIKYLVFKGSDTIIFQVYKPGSK